MNITNEQPTVRVEQQKTQRVEINEKNPSVLVCVYGTLRRGNGNYRAILEGRAEYLGTNRSEPKYTMYGRKAGFPMLTDKGDTSIEYETFRVTDSRVLERMHGLEGCSGIPGHKDNWYDIVPIETPYGSAWIYLMHDLDRAQESIIPTGNWNDKNL